jgi:tetratricopeptide (TPR) repeat protein
MAGVARSSRSPDVRRVAHDQPPPSWRDRWAWASALAVLVPVLAALGAPFGEPVAEDFDFLQRALFGPFRFFDGGGSQAFWRPIPHQLYYLAFGRLMLASPWVVAAAHAAALALTAFLLCRTFRVARPGPWAFAVATAPLLAESARFLVVWPSTFVDVGMWLFVAAFLHEVSRRRLPSALAALLAALLCKEVALVAAVLAPWLPGVGPDTPRARVRWTIAAVGVAAAWGALALVVRAQAQLALPHQTDVTSVAERLAWAFGNSMRAIASLAATPASRDVLVLGALAAIPIAAAFVLATRRRSAERAGPSWRMIGWGAAWFVAATATLVPIHPHWVPSRSAFAALGLMAAAAELVWAAHPALLAALVGARLGAFALAPPAPAGVVHAPPETGAFMDFERVARLQHLMRAFRTTLRERLPEPPPGARVGFVYLPLGASYAFGGSNALRAWYGRSDVRAISLTEIQMHPDSALDAALSWEPERTPPVSWLAPVAVQEGFRARAEMREADWDSALVFLDRAERAADPKASTFRGLMAAQRARSLLHADRLAEAEAEAQRALELFGQSFEAHYVLAGVAYLRDDLASAVAHADSALLWAPNDPDARQLRRNLRAEAGG